MSWKLNYLLTGPLKKPSMTYCAREKRERPRLLFIHISQWTTGPVLSSYAPFFLTFPNVSVLVFLWFLSYKKRERTIKEHKHAFAIYKVGVMWLLGFWVIRRWSFFYLSQVYLLKNNVKEVHTCCICLKSCNIKKSKLHPISSLQHLQVGPCIMWDRAIHLRSGPSLW